MLETSLILSCGLVLAALGGLLSERSGIIDIGIEGKMLVAASAAAIIGSNTGQPLLGLIAAMIAAMLLGLLHFTLTQVYQLDGIVSGMSLNLFAIGATSFLDKIFQRPSGVPTLPKPLFGLLAVLAVAALAFLLLRGRWGWHLLAVGNDPDKAREVGLDPKKVRMQALALGGVMCGLSGTLIMTNIGGFSDGMTAGRGFIALAALIVGGWKPVPTLFACLLFGTLDAAQIQFQGNPIFGIHAPPVFWNVLPYAITLVAMAGWLGRSKPPAGLGRI